MPEHVHIMIYPQDQDYSISQMLISIKKPVSERAVAYVKCNAPHFLLQMTDRQPSGKETFRFWQRGGGYDRNLWSADYIWQNIDYIHDNPVRRGLCDSPQDWIWSSASTHLEGRPGLISLDLDALPPDPRNK